MEDWQKWAEDFLKESHLYQLGILPTEQPHPQTVHLSRWAIDDLDRALNLLRDLDVAALQVVGKKLDEIGQMAMDIQNCLDRGGRIFLAGCGATGRLSLSLECLWRKQRPGSDQVVSFMAGGDVALVRAVEGFEDFPQLGEKQLLQLGFGPDDLLIACTEGGETPFVIGTVEAAARVSRNSPYFLFCNPTDLLRQKVERSRRVIENNKIKKLEIFVGPMALAGSTRMQATTVLQMAVGLALLVPQEKWATGTQELLRSVQSEQLFALAPFIEKESQIYSRGEYVLYFAESMPITVFTDTTERAPTFSLPPFDHSQEKRDIHSLCYVLLPQAESAQVAWKMLLGRDPRPLNWSEYAATSTEYLLGFDFSQQAQAMREKLIPQKSHHAFRIQGAGPIMKWSLDDLDQALRLPQAPELFQHLYLKMLLNTHSTLVMGRIGRYQNNLMTWVMPSNGKLIDRAVRYARHLLEHEGLSAKTEDLVYELFRQMPTRKSDQSIVLMIRDALRTRLTGQ